MSLDTSTIHIYTDGSYIKKGKNIFCGYGIYFPNAEYKSISRKFTHEPITNNRAELYAILKSIILANKVDHKRKIDKKTRIKKVIIYSDSEYSVKTFNEWYPKWQKNGKDYLNKDIIDEVMNAKNSVTFDIAFQHVRSHTGKTDIHSKSNDIVDELAKRGALREDTMK